MKCTFFAEKNFLIPLLLFFAIFSSPLNASDSNAGSFDLKQSEKVEVGISVADDYKEIPFFEDRQLQEHSEKIYKELKEYDRVKAKKSTTFCKIITFFADEKNKIIRFFPREEVFISGWIGKPVLFRDESLKKNNLVEKESIYLYDAIYDTSGLDLGEKPRAGNFAINLPINPHDEQKQKEQETPKNEDELGIYISKKLYRTGCPITLDQISSGSFHSETSAFFYADRLKKNGKIKLEAPLNGVSKAVYAIFCTKLHCCPKCTSRFLCLLEKDETTLRDQISYLSKKEKGSAFSVPKDCSLHVIFLVCTKKKELHYGGQHQKVSEVIKKFRHQKIKRKPHGSTPPAQPSKKKLKDNKSQAQAQGGEEKEEKEEESPVVSYGPFFDGNKSIKHHFIMANVVEIPESMKMDVDENQGGQCKN